MNRVEWRNGRRAFWRPVSASTPSSGSRASKRRSKAGTKEGGNKVAWEEAGRGYVAKGRNNSTFAELARTCHTPKTRTRTHTCPFPFRSPHVNRQRDTYHADCRNGNEGEQSERTGGGKGTTEESARTERIGGKRGIRIVRGK